MNKLVREHYPVSDLPEDLREGFENGSDVTITVETGPRQQDPVERPASVAQVPTSSESWVEQGKRVRQQNFASGEEVDAYMRWLRE